MGTTVRVSIARVSANALVAAALCTLVAGVGAASASATPFPAECSNLQMAINEVAGATQHGEGDVIVLNGMCDAANLASPTGVTLPAGSSFSIEGKSGTTSGFDGTDVTGPLLGNVPSTEAGAMTLGHLTFQHAKNVSALSIRASRVTLSDDSFLENEEQGGSEHAAFVDVGQSPANCPPPTGPAAITVTDSTFLRNKLVLGSGRGGGGAAWLEDTCEPSRNVLEGNIFEGNTLEAAGTAGEVEVTGGGLQFVGAKKQPTPVSQSGNVFDSNGIVAKESAEGNYGGGGEWLQDASLSSVGDRFSRNMIAGTSSHEESAWSWGAGLGIDNFDLDCSAALPESTLEDVVVTGNAIGPGYTEALGGGGIYVGCTHLRVLDSTFTLNTAPAGAGIEGESNDQLELANSIVAEDSGGNEIAGFNKPAAGGSLIATYSDVCSYAGSSEPVPGTGNICANPLLADNGEPVSFDVHETASSPTIDAGSNALVPDGLTTDFYGTPRILAGYASCSQSFPAVVDMGAAELQPAQPSCPAAVQQQTKAAPPAPGLTHFVSLGLSSTGIALRLSCTSTDGQGCSGMIYVTSNETLKGKKIVAVGTSGRAKTPVRIAQGSFSLPAGATATFQVKLNSTGLELLRKFHAYSAWVLANEAMPNNSQVIFLLHTTRFNEPKQKHKKSKQHKAKTHHG